VSALLGSFIEQTALDYEEETEAVLKEFIKTELEITDADQIIFQNVHRLRKRNDDKPRNIIARFTHYKDHERVRKVVIWKFDIVVCISFLFQLVQVYHSYLLMFQNLDSVILN
jgi:hypothetical protein